jgi:putative membrane protein
MMNGMNQAWGLGISWIIGLLTLAIIIWLVIKVMNPKSNFSLRMSKSPMDVLKKRYARGKIGKKEFNRRRSAIL